MTSSLIATSSQRCVSPTTEQRGLASSGQAWDGCHEAEVKLTVKELFEDRSLFDASLEHFVDRSRGV